MNNIVTYFEIYLHGCVCPTIAWALGHASFLIILILHPLFHIGFCRELDDFFVLQYNILIH